MVHREFGRVPDDGGDHMALLQRLVDQVLPRLPGGSQHCDLHPQPQSELILLNSVPAAPDWKFPLFRKCKTRLLRYNKEALSKKFRFVI